MNSNFSSTDSFTSLSNSSSNTTTIDKKFPTKRSSQKQNYIHEQILQFIQRKIQKDMALEDYELDYINNDCDEEEQLYFIKIYVEMVQKLRDNKIIKQNNGENDHPKKDE